MKHEPVVIHVEELRDKMCCNFSDEEILELLGEENDVFFRVVHPEHVLFPRFNSDASYQYIGKLEELDNEDLNRIV